MKCSFSFCDSDIFRRVNGVFYCQEHCKEIWDMLQLWIKDKERLRGGSL